MPQWLVVFYRHLINWIRRVQSDFRSFAALQRQRVALAVPDADPGQSGELRLAGAALRSPMRWQTEDHSDPHSHSAFLRRD
jgi:hypothetical protein